MARPAKRKRMIAGSALALAGALAVVVTIAADGQDTATHSSSARGNGIARAQHVEFVSPGLEGHKLLDLRVKNEHDVDVTFCVDNSAVGAVCTPEIGNDAAAGTRAEMDRVDVSPQDSVAKVILQRVGGNSEIDVPVSMGTVTTHCIFVTGRVVGDGKGTLDIREDPSCKDF